MMEDDDHDACGVPAAFRDRVAPEQPVQGGQCALLRCPVKP
jgi:hypothetical protein